MTLALHGKTRKRQGWLIAIAVATLALATIAGGTLRPSETARAAGPPTVVFSQGFETDTSGWITAPTRVTSGTNGVPSKTGAFHAETTSGGGEFTRWGGYGFTPGCSGSLCAASFPSGGYTTSMDLYLDMATSAPSDTRFDFSSAISDPAGAFRRDFILTGGFYNDSDITGVGPRFVFSASNNSPGWPKNPARSPFAVNATGWVTIEHRFFDSGAGVLAVTVTLRDSAGIVLTSWTLSDPSDVIGSTVGGNRYGWFVTNGFSSLAIDNSVLTTPPPQCTFTTVGLTDTLDGDCVIDETIFIAAGHTLDGGGHTITAVDPVGGHFLGAVVRNHGTEAHVRDLTVTASGLANVCDEGDARLRGILFQGASGSITNNTVVNVNQGPSGCQEGNAIEVRNAPFDTSGSDVAVTISGNNVSGYIKNGITANGSVAATITGNTVTGAGPVGVPLAAQNGIQIGFGATAVVTGNTVTGNNYTPASYVACGILLYQADGVRQSKNTLSSNERDMCNFGKGGGQFNPNP